MKQIRVIIDQHDHPSALIPVVSISKLIAKTLKIPMGHPLTLRCSDQVVTIICRFNSAKSKIMQLDPFTARSLGIPHQCHLRLSYDSHFGELRLNPIFAILVSGVSTRNPPFSKMNPYFEELLRFARQRHLFAYVVTISELSKKNERVNGWIHSKNQWRTEELPWPQVVYNRVSSRRIEKKNRYRQLKQKLHERQIDLFNQMFLDKWKVHQQLLNDASFSPYLPYSQLFHGTATLNTMLKRYSTLFIKPIHGSLGRGIYRISKTITGFQSQYSTANSQIHKHFGKVSSLYAYLSKRLKPNRYIIQQGIPLLHMNGRAIDFRILMQKNKVGKWVTTSMVARIGPENRFVSNVAIGGKISKVGHVLEQCRIKNPKQARQQLAMVAKKACEAVESTLGGHFGELGVDLAMTSQGSVYLLEINSKPSKTEDGLPSVGKGRPSVHRLLDYIIYLTHDQKK